MLGTDIFKKHAKLVYRERAHFRAPLRWGVCVGAHRRAPKHFFVGVIMRRSLTREWMKKKT